MIPHRAVPAEHCRQPGIDQRFGERMRHHTAQARRLLAARPEAALGVPGRGGETGSKEYQAWPMAAERGDHSGGIGRLVAPRRVLQQQHRAGLIAGLVPPRIVAVAGEMQGRGRMGS